MRLLDRLLGRRKCPYCDKGVVTITRSDTDLTVISREGCWVCKGSGIYPGK